VWEEEQRLREIKRFLAASVTNAELGSAAPPLQAIGRCQHELGTRYPGRQCKQIRVGRPMNDDSDTGTIHRVKENKRHFSRVSSVCTFSNALSGVFSTRNCGPVRGLLRTQRTLLIIHTDLPTRDVRTMSHAHSFAKILSLFKNFLSAAL
jgi:hypothetical protein